MKILHLIGGTLSSGAAKGAYLLHQGLIDLGVNSKVLTSSAETFNNPSVESITQRKNEKAFNFIRAQMDLLPLNFYRRRQEHIFSNNIFGYNFTRHPLYEWADIINLHWINGGFVSINDISKINKPVIWTMRDMWPMSGGCHYTMECNKYLTGCGKCPQLGSDNNNDLSAWNIRRKQKHLPEELIFVGISKWLSKCAKESHLLKNQRVITFYNCINDKEFFPVDKKIAKNISLIPADKKVILFGAADASSFHKGFDKFVKALEYLYDKSKYLFLFFGKIEKSLVEDLNINYISLGYLSDSISLRLAYSAADIFVAPAVMEAFGKTIAEAMACGTPCIAFNATGPQDIIDHKKNGYLAKPYLSTDLAQGIEWLLNHPKPEEIANNARQRVLDCFTIEKIAEKYKKLYEEVLQGF